MPGCREGQAAPECNPRPADAEWMTTLQTPPLPDVPFARARSNVFTRVSVGIVNSAVAERLVHERFTLSTKRSTAGVASSPR